jgi:intracellular sulfur oxidation DsrE/DsrF family protein
MRKIFAVAAAACFTLGGAAYYSKSSAAPPAPLGVEFPQYEPQKVVYHVTSGASWFGKEHRQRLKVLSNHIAALPPASSDLRVVMQGDGVDLLIAARKDAFLAAEIDRLKVAGVRFLICANTMGARKLDTTRDLHGAARTDFVRAGVAEAARLQGAGYVYMKI